MELKETTAWRTWWSKDHLLF